MKRTLIKSVSVAAVVIISAGILMVLNFSARLPHGAYTDQYPRKTSRLIEAIGAGPGTYDLFAVYGPMSAICISFSGIDPRQLAINLLNKNRLEVGGAQPFFTLEGVATLIVFDETGQFNIEEIDKDVLLFSSDGPILNNTCVDRPQVARVVVAPSQQALSLARFSAKIDLR